MSADSTRSTDGDGTADDSHDEGSIHSEVSPLMECTSLQREKQTEPMMEQECTLKCTMDEPEPRVMSGRIKERYVIDDRGWWVVFDVPEDHYLHGCYAATTSQLVPKDAKVEVIRGVLPGSLLEGGPNRGRKSESDAEDYGFKKMFGDDASTSSENPSPAKCGDTKAGSIRDLRIKELEKELNKAKARLQARGSLKKKVGLLEGAGAAVESTYETVEDEDERHHKTGKATTDRSQTEYETGKDSDFPYKDHGRHASKARRHRKLTRRSGSESDVSRRSYSEDSIASMIRKCLAQALPTILEEKTTRNKESIPTLNLDRASGNSAAEATAGQAPPQGGVPANPGAPTPGLDGEDKAQGWGLQGAFNPHMMPLMKFKGENWEDFIEHFESFADACGMTAAYKLQYLLMSLEGKPRAYAKKEEGVPFTYASVRQRLQHRYGKKESAFEIRHQLRSVQRKPGESLEEFSDRLQEIAQQGTLDDKDRDELFYFAFLNAVGDIPKMQYYIEQAHTKNRNLRLSDLLALAREYLEKSPTARRRSVAVNVCKPISQRKGRLTHDDDEVMDEVEKELGKIDQERKDKKEASFGTIRKDVAFLLKEYEFHNKCIKYNGLHYNLKEKAKNFKGQLRPRDAPPLERTMGESEGRKFKPRPSSSATPSPRKEEGKEGVSVHTKVDDPPDRE